MNEWIDFYSLLPIHCHTIIRSFVGLSIRILTSMVVCLFFFSLSFSISRKNWASAKRSVATSESRIRYSTCSSLKWHKWAPRLIPHSANEIWQSVYVFFVSFFGGPNSNFVFLYEVPEHFVNKSLVRVCVYLYKWFCLCLCQVFAHKFHQIINECAFTTTNVR